MNTPWEPRNYFSNEGQQIFAGYIRSVSYVSQSVREKVKAQALPPDQVEYLRRVYVRIPAGEGAIEALRALYGVALVGPRGCGRRITGVHAITELHATPHPIYLDPDDTRRDLPADSGCGYIIDIDEQTVRELPSLKEVLAAYRDQLAQAGAYLVVTATPAAWSALGPHTGLGVVPVRAAPPAAVFRSHLGVRRADEVDGWSSHPDVLAVLIGAAPGEAVRLAELANESLATASGEAAIQQALNAYRNWSEQLDRWFKENGGGYPRALLLAAAALNEAKASTVFAAADKLGQVVKLERPAGGGLVGAGVTELLDRIGADLTDDGRIRLPRPAYPESVLDHVWDDRPHLRVDLKRWLRELPGGLHTPDAESAGYALIALAIRQADADLITDAVRIWADQPACLRLAVAALTAASVSDSIGRVVRGTMYGWVSGGKTSRSLLLIVADVCGGQYGKSFPRNAMTRLRHLSRSDDAEVRDRVVAALAALAGEPAIRDRMLRDIIAWAQDDGALCLPGIRALLTLGEGGGDLLSWTGSDPGKIELLAGGLRAALRHGASSDQTSAMCLGWLEAAADATQPADVVTDVIGRTCRNSSDIGTVTTLVWGWAHASGELATPARRKVCDELMRKATDRDPITPGIHAVSLYQAVYEEEVR